MEQKAYGAGYPAKKSNRGTVTAVIVIAIIVVPVIFIMISSNSTKEYIYREFHITLNSGYKELSSSEKLSIISFDAFNHINPDYSLKNNEKSMYLYRDTKSDAGTDDLEEFGEKVRELFREGDPTSLSWHNNYCYFVITKDMVDLKTGKETGDKAKSVVAMFRNNDLFWTVDIGEPEKSFREENYLKLTDTVKFVE